MGTAPVHPAWATPSATVRAANTAPRSLRPLGNLVSIDVFGWDICGYDLLYLYLSAPGYFLLGILADMVLNFPALAVHVHQGGTKEMTNPVYST